MLLIRPYPQTTDTLPNYLLRLTAANGYKNSMQLLRDEHCLLANNRLPGKKIFFGDFDLERVAKLANTNAHQLSELRLKHTFSTRCLAFGQVFLTKAVNFSCVRVCPHCYQEQGSIPFYNSLVAKTFCIKHNCPLITVHPVTGRKLTWATHYLWRDIASWCNNVSSVEVGEAELTINQQIEYLENNQIIIGRQQLDLAEYCDLLEFFAHFHQFAFGSSPNNQTKNDIDFNRQYYAAAHWYIADWPTPFFELLAHFENNPMSDKRLTGVRKCFRDLYDDIYSYENSRSGAYKLLKSGFEEYLSDHFSSGMLMSSLSQIDFKVRDKSTYVSETQVTELLCCHLGKVKVYVREGLLSYSHVLPNGTNLFFRSDVIKLKSRLTNYCSIDECAELLGISVYLARQLLRADIVQPLLEPNAENRDWLVEKSQIEELIGKLKSSADLSIKKSNTAQKRFTFVKIGFGRLIQSMLAGDISFGYKPNKKRPLSLEQFTPYFDANDEPITDFLSPTEATIELGVNINAIYDFIKLGYLECEKQQVKRTARPIKMITQKSIENFKSKYRLSRQLKTSSYNLQLVSGPRIDGCCVNLYCKCT
tara:strand:- start:2283 stop:4052 length:1770 start_codon:yes stop_codon:yes gene_type:complete